MSKKPNNNTYSEKVEEGHISIYGAREHNLKNIDLRIPRNKLVVFTGLSGSGKSSLAFDTLFAEGQRRYMETFASYARQYIGEMKRPDVEKIDGLSPVISIEQKTGSRNPRSTVGTTTEIYDFLRLLYARIGEAYSWQSGKKMVRYNEDQLLSTILEKHNNNQVSILAPVVKSRKGHYRELFEQYRKKGYTKIRIDGKLKEIIPKMQLNRYSIHDIELLIDRIKVTPKSLSRIKPSIQLALKEGKGTLIIINENENDLNYYSKNLMCPESGISYDEPQPNTFSFNSPYGACPECKGLGIMHQIDEDVLILNNKKSIREGGMLILDPQKDHWTSAIIRALATRYSLDLNTPIKDIPKDILHKIMHGTEEEILVKTTFMEYETRFEGLIDRYKNQINDTDNNHFRDELKEHIPLVRCPECNGSRLKKEARYFKIDKKNIYEVSSLQLTNFHQWVNSLESKLKGRSKIIGSELLKELKGRTSFLLDVGLGYLSLDRAMYSLSGGESQRIRLATQIGSQLINVSYIIDEPSIGLHQRDNHKLIKALKELADIGNTVLVVEHDKEMMEASDYIVDLGPNAGLHGGSVAFEGHVKDIIHTNSLTADYLSGRKKIEVPSERRAGNGKLIELKGAKGHNLKNVKLKLPLGKLVCVTGVSGSGKSSLINETLYPIIRNNLYRTKIKPLAYSKLIGLEHIDKVIEIDQSAIGRTPRSNPATYTGTFTQIRNLFAQLPEAKIRGYKPGRFSFNVKGGRCDECEGAGVKTIEMNFLPDVYIQCPKCMGRRYNRETLEVRFKGKSITDVLNMTHNQALKFFENIPQLKRRLKTMVDVGLGYITLGQSSVTISGGEAQRVKLATELAKKDTGKTLYILDEPTTGLHFEDIRILMDVLNKFVNKGNTVLIIEHNLDVVKLADHIIDLGPDGGEDGGRIICEGTPEEIVLNNCGHTAGFLKKELN
ncbi:MAG: excinuclease ABC subunit UvrA [Bacteroidetes bacterium]|nr:excinuclease ABC subunit UvrA [Bacteroidota bacterium]